MPDPVLFLKGMAAAAAASAILALALSLARRPAGTTRINLVWVLAQALGIVLGCAVLELRPGWPPANSLDRHLAIVLPSVIGIELIGAFAWVPRWLVWILRLILAGAAGRILLHGSSYLMDGDGPWTAGQAWLALILSGAVLAGVWSLLIWLSHRSPGVSIPLALAETSLSGGVAVMLAGYLSGGQAALPLGAALGGAAIALGLTAARPMAQAALGIGIVGLFGALFLGEFFGGLSTERALVLLCAPLLCWVTEMRYFRNQRPWLIGALRLGFVAVPLVVVLGLIKRDFDRDMGLMEQTSANAARAAPPSEG